MISSEGSTGPLVIDLGSSTIRAGFAGLAQPTLVEHASIGRHGKDSIFPVSFEKPRSQTEIVPIWKLPEGSGKTLDLCNEESLFAILRATVDDAHTGYKGMNDESSSLSPVLISEPSVQNIAYRQKVIQLLFEKLGARAAFVCKRSVLSAFSVGKTNAIVVSSGAGITSVSCVVGGHASQHFYSSWNFAGNSLDIEIREKLRQQNPSLSFLPSSYASSTGVTKSFRDYAERFHIQRMKEAVCRIAENKDIRVNVNTAAYELPDGTMVDCNKIAQSVPEMLFTGKDKSIGAMVHDVIEKQRSSDESLAHSLLGSVVVCGGTSCMSGFTERIQNDLSQMYQSNVVKCFAGQANQDKRNSAWIGGSIVGSLGAFGNLWITKREYEENGVGIVGKKCP
jgi:actin-like protein 6A